LEGEKSNIESQIKAEAFRLGFSDCGISEITTHKDAFRHYQNWLSNGFHAQMEYMERNQQLRENPDRLIEGAQSVVSVLLTYNIPSRDNKTQFVNISKYAQHKDYHKVIKKKLKALLKYIQTQVPHAEARFFTDSAPLFEKAMAQQSGLGWIGKNTLLIHKKLGSFVFIGELVLNIKLSPDTPHLPYCGNCTLCIDACPTHAIVAPYQINSNLCISYQTIENKGFIPDSIISKIQNHIFGCDICQTVCPWNTKNSVFTKDADLTLKNTIPNFKLSEILEMNRLGFDQTFEGSPIKRAGFEKIKQTANQIYMSLSKKNI